MVNPSNCLLNKPVVDILLTMLLFGKKGCNKKYWIISMHPMQ